MPAAPAAWVAGDEVYGADPELRATVQDTAWGTCWRIGCNRAVPTARRAIRASIALPAQLPKRAWQRLSRGHREPRASATTPGRWIELLAEDDADTGQHHLLIRRNDNTGELAYCAATAHSRSPCRLCRGGRVALEDRGIVPSRQRPDRAGRTPGPALDLLVPLDHPGHARPCLPRRRYRRRTRHPAHPDGLIMLTVNEFRRPLRRTAATARSHHRHLLAWSRTGAENTKPEPAHATTDAATPMTTIYGCSTRRLVLPVG